jgi:hypothetical protein
VLFSTSYVNLLTLVDYYQPDQPDCIIGSQFAQKIKMGLGIYHFSPQYLGVRNLDTSAAKSVRNVGCFAPAGGSEH